MTHAINLLQTAEYQARLDQCCHCGLCLPACPTYAVNGREAESPRGRIVLMRAASAGRIALDAPALTENLGSCLACRACEPACPSGVHYGELIEGARSAISATQTPGPARRFLSWLGLRQLMPHVGRLRLLALGAWLYQRSGAQTLAHKLGLIPAALRPMEALAPQIQLRRKNPLAPARAPRRGRVAVLQGCVQEAFLGQVNDATIRVLQRNGYEVVIPPGQTCCGAAQLHADDEEQARVLARQNIDALLAIDADAIISNAGGCGATLKEYPHLLRNDPDYQTRVRAFTARVRDISEFLAEQPIEPPCGRLDARVTYVDSCHLRNAQKVVRQPRELLRSIPGLELVELRQPERCCGSAGIYNITHPEMAGPILDTKMADVAAIGAEIVAVSNTGCHLQLIAGVRQAGLKARVLHVVELLDMAYASEG